MPFGPKNVVFPQEGGELVPKLILIIKSLPIIRDIIRFTAGVRCGRRRLVGDDAGRRCVITVAVCRDRNHLCEWGEILLGIRGGNKKTKGSGGTRQLKYFRNKKDQSLSGEHANSNTTTGEN